MRLIAIVLVLAQIGGATAVLAQASGGTGGSSGGSTGASSPGAASGGSLGTSAGSPGTNSLGTAAPSGSGTTGSAATGTGDPRVDKKDRDVDNKVKSICKGC
ncbi:hypothetical protein HMPREF9695_01889 [Afipia broomeae ATCC 49717]|uniref:Uncharacterized protein n=1 Tax=Afipia broomeae ATCC 49717 TaxID=883078 RepID=K8PBB3_9BRAD|nr:hypothetical protein HMPREF9695_01889 [Afipia broomeae ATCC 49717]